MNLWLRQFLLTTLFIATLLGSLPAQAQQDYEQWLAGTMATRMGQPREWRVVMGSGAVLAPEYRGADDYEGKALPLLDIEWRGAYFASTQRGLGVNMFRQRSTSVGPRITYDLGRKSSDSKALIGIPDVDPTVEVGVFAEHFMHAWRFKADLRMGLNGHEGIIGSFDIALGGALANRSSLIIGANVHAADDKYMQAYYSVPAGGSPNFTFFQPGASLRDMTGYATFTYVITDNLYATLNLNTSLLFGDAADSPLSISDDQYFVGTMIAYRL